MSKLLEKALKDAVKESKCELGTKQVLKSLKNSKLVVVTDSIQKEKLEKIQQEAKEAKVPTVHFDGSSVALGRLCGLQFRVSAASFNSLAATNVKSIIKEAEKKS
jgi:large subunit ribosomal protein L30e